MYGNISIGILPYGKTNPLNGVHECVSFPGGDNFYSVLRGKGLYLFCNGKGDVFFFYFAKFGAFIPAAWPASIITVKILFALCTGGNCLFFERKITDVTATASNDRQIRVRKNMFCMFLFLKILGYMVTFSKLFILKRNIACLKYVSKFTAFFI